MGKKNSNINITSNNQSGGITAQNVNSGSGSFKVIDNRTSKKQRKPRNILVVISSIVIFLASLATLLSYLGIFPFKE